MAFTFYSASKHLITFGKSEFEHAEEKHVAKVRGVNVQIITSKNTKGLLIRQQSELMSERIKAAKNKLNPLQLI